MRELATTGWINFRLRQLVTSYGVQLLQLPPAEVGAALAEMFDDYEPGITWPQVAINDGRIGQEKGPRILNPVKQGHDLDPSEAYVRKWLPELTTVPAGMGARAVAACRQSPPDPAGRPQGGVSRGPCKVGESCLGIKAA